MRGITMPRLIAHAGSDGKLIFHAVFFWLVELLDHGVIRIPIRHFPLTKGLVVDYDFHLTIGSLDEIRARFAKPGKK